MTHGGITDVDYGAMIRALNQVHYAGETDFYGAAPLRECEEMLCRRLRSHDTVLDVGCGAGRVSRALAERGQSVVGVDINAAALEVARSTCEGASFLLGSMTDLPLSTGTFNQVWCLRFSFNALPTQDERLAALAELWRVCAPAGRVFVEVFNWHYAGRYGLVRVANVLEQLSRVVRWHGQGHVGSRPIPARDIIYLANKGRHAAPGYAHLTTRRELHRLLAICGLRAHAVITTEANVHADHPPEPRSRHFGYSMWMVLRKDGQPS